MPIASIYNAKDSMERNCVRDIYRAIFNINHFQGQEHCGIVYFDGRGLSSNNRITANGLVKELKIPKDARGYCGIGNVSKFQDHQPLIIYCKRLGNFALTFDGYIINSDELRRDLGDAFLSPYHAELAGRLIAQGSDFPDGIKKMAEVIKGAFSVGILSESGESYAARCPFGTRPLMLGQGKNGYGIISESRAFRKIGMSPERDFEPGEIVQMDRFGIRTIGKMEGKYTKICSFDPGYYFWIDSLFEGIPVVAIRHRVATKQAEKDRKEGLEIDIVCAVEDSGKAYGEGYAFYFGRPYFSIIIKYPYFGRSYDQPTQEERDDEAEGKCSTVDHLIGGRKIVVYDDSLRRATVIKKILKYLKNAGAKEIHLRFGTPKNRAYCRIDTREAPDDALIANQFETDEEIAGHLKVDSVRFPEVDEYVDAITQGSKLKKDDLCLGCYTGDFDFWK